MHIWPHEKNQCLQIPRTEARLGQNIGHILDELSLSTHSKKSEQTYYLSCACNSSSDDIFIKLIDDFFSKYLNSFHRVKITSGLF